MNFCSYCKKNISEAAEMSLKETLNRQKPGPFKTTDTLDTKVLARGQTDTDEKMGNRKSQ